MGSLQELQHLQSKNKLKFHNLATWGWMMRKGKMEFRDMLHYFIWIFPGFTLDRTQAAKSVRWLHEESLMGWHGVGHSRLRKSWKGIRQNLLSTVSRSLKTMFGPVHLSSAPTETTPGLKSTALGSAHSTFPYGLRPFARNFVMYSVVKGNCAAQPKRRHLGEPCELRLNRKFLSCCRERFPTTAYPLLTWTIPYCLAH